MSDNSPKVVKKTVKLGDLPYFSDVDDSGKPLLQFDKSHIPTVAPPTEITDLEFALITSTRFDNQNKERLEQKLTASLLTINP